MLISASHSPSSSTIAPPAEEVAQPAQPTPQPATKPTSPRQAGQPATKLTQPAEEVAQPATKATSPSQPAQPARLGGVNSPRQSGKPTQPAIKATHVLALVLVLVMGLVAGCGGGGGGGAGGAGGGGGSRAGICETNATLCLPPDPIGTFTTTDNNTPKITNPIRQNFTSHLTAGNETGNPNPTHPVTANLTNLGIRTTGDDYTTDTGLGKPDFFSNADEYRFTHDGTDVRGGSGLDRTDTLATHKFASAYSRGWTGKGVTIAVADSGIDVVMHRNGTPDYTGASTNRTDPHTGGNITAHPEFLGKIKNMTNFVINQQPMDVLSTHGTASAGAIAARRDGKGLHGGAFDADLLIAKIAEGRTRTDGFATAINPDYIFQAMAWAKDNDADIINLSLAVANLPQDYRDSLRPVRHANGSVVAGEWYSTHPDYGKIGLDGAVLRAAIAKQAIGDDMVMVLAAGNSALPQSVGLSQMATATDNAGDLILDGQVIIAGWWYDNINQIRGNRAGNVCNYWNATAGGGRGACIDAAKVSDFYILAEGGPQFTIAYDRHDRDLPGGTPGYGQGEGSSLSAPLVSSGIAILKQMWPHLKANQLVQVLLRSANRTFEGYATHIHGQGIMDMDNATRPIGTHGIPTRGITHTTTLGGGGGGVYAGNDGGGDAGSGDAGGAGGAGSGDAGGGGDVGSAGSGGSGAGSGDAGGDGGGLLAVRGSVRLTHLPSPDALAALSDVMLLDEFHRNFPIDLTPLVTRRASSNFLGGSGSGSGLAGLAESKSGSVTLVDYFAEYLAADRRVLLPPIPLTANSAVRVGFGASDGHVLGNAFSGILGTTRSSHTLYGLWRYGMGAGAVAGGEAGWGTGVYAQLGLGVSYAEFDTTGSLLAEAEPMLSSTATLGYGFDVADVFGAGAGGAGEVGAGGHGQARDWGQVRVSASQPLRFERARLHYDLPVGRTLGGAVVRETRVVDFAPRGREVDLGIHYGVGLSGETRLVGFAGQRVSAVAGERRVGIRVVREF